MFPRFVLNNTDNLVVAYNWPEQLSNVPRSRRSREERCFKSERRCSSSNDMRGAVVAPFSNCLGLGVDVNPQPGLTTIYEFSSSIFRNGLLAWRSLGISDAGGLISEVSLSHTRNLDGFGLQVASMLCDEPTEMDWPGAPHADASLFDLLHTPTVLCLELGSWEGFLAAGYS